MSVAYTLAGVRDNDDDNQNIIENLRIDIWPTKQKSISGVFAYFLFLPILQSEIR